MLTLSQIRTLATLADYVEKGHPRMAATVSRALQEGIAADQVESVLDEATAVWNEAKLACTS